MFHFKIGFKSSAFLPIFSLTFANLFCIEENFDDQRFYPNPGIVAFRDGRWVGSDHLYNLTNKIDIVVEFFTPPNVVLPVTKEAVKTTITEIFKKARITPPTDLLLDKPPLPFFHMLIMVYPLEKGYVAYCEGRLFERIELNRVKPDEQTAMQGITWESQNLIIASKEDLANQVTKSVDEIATAFANRYRFYEDIRMEIQRNKS
jgi:hypothetical protein